MKKHDKDQFVFSFHTAAINYSIGKEFGIQDTMDLRLLFEAGLFHDTGKLGMSSDFINYPGSYTLLMYNEMKKHAQGGSEILEKINAEIQIVEAARYHHCNVDGSGYPGGLYGKEIPLYARITRISDSLDAYLSKRCYKEGGPAREALNDLSQYLGISYDPELIECFVSIHKRILKKAHNLGEDRPSHRMYMDLLVEHYLYDFPIKKVENILDLFQ
ncbi:HD domain-containing phosphohydrolase [Bacillus mexicanus]|uniref:HD-GYP domain-containing protein n=1 Tax=Bacillus mexicanus TaxID=2834415 RepID=UPI003D1B87FC